MVKFYLSSFTLVLLSFFSYSQNTLKEVEKVILKGSEIQLIKENSRLTQEEFLYLADKVADRLLEINPNSSNYNYRKGFTALHSQMDPILAKKHFEKAIILTSSNYDAFSKNEPSAPHDAYFHLADCNHKLGDFDKAIELLNKYKELSRKESELIADANLHIIQCENAKKAYAQKGNYTVNNLNSLNTEYADFVPLISLDGSVLNFTSRRLWENKANDAYRERKRNEMPDDSYESNFSSNGWSSPKLASFNTAELSESFLAQSMNEREILIFSDSTGNGDVYFGVIEKSALSLTQDSIFVSDYWETHATFSSDGNTMYFTTDKLGGIGGKDIYMSSKTSAGKWSSPIALGINVNTIYDEESPFLSFNDQILYFASNGPKSIGGYDVMYSKMNEDKTWGASQNMGYPFNSPFDDVFYSTTMDGKTGYYSSNRSGGKGNLDIYYIENNPISLTDIAVFNGSIKTSTGADLPEEVAIRYILKCVDCVKMEQNITLSPRLRDGIFSTALESCKTYSIALYNIGKDQPFQEETFSTDCNLSYQEVNRNYIYDMNDKLIKVAPKEITPVDTIQPDAFKNIEMITYFDYNKNKISAADKEFKNFLNQLSSQIDAGRKNITIEIYSSASKVPTIAFSSNQQLAEFRAENMKKLLNEFLASKPSYKSVITLKTTLITVDGPDYQKDALNKNKYRPYQFVGLKTK
ncbi:MAG: tetratricopeptide repeat protein [Haliscomenobacter sp.]|nr:tetratricopeptide repeat protein [Haliscomenobacter sp.]